MAIIKKIKQYNPSSSLWDEYDLGAMAENITFSSNVGLQDLFVQTENGPVLSSSYGGTGLTSISNRIIDLGSSVSGNPLTQNIGVSGILPIGNGGAGFKQGSSSYTTYIKAWTNPSSVGNPAASVLNSLDFVLNTTSNHEMYNPATNKTQSHPNKRLAYYRFSRWGKVVSFVIAWQLDYKYPASASTYWRAACRNNITNSTLGTIKNSLLIPEHGMVFRGSVDDTGVSPIVSISTAGIVQIQGYDFMHSSTIKYANAFEPGTIHGQFRLYGTYVTRN